EHGQPKPPAQGGGGAARGDRIVGNKVYPPTLSATEPLGNTPRGCLDTGGDFPWLRQQLHAAGERAVEFVLAFEPGSDRGIAAQRCGAVDERMLRRYLPEQQRRF